MLLVNSKLVAGQFCVTVFLVDFTVYSNLCYVIDSMLPTANRQSSPVSVYVATTLCAYAHCYTLCPKKNIPDVISRNLNKE